MASQPHARGLVAVVQQQRPAVAVDLGAQLRVRRCSGGWVGWGEEVEGRVGGVGRGGGEYFKDAVSEAKYVLVYLSGVLKGINT